jgi:tetratricopeptide (TPR) repeat protein
MNKQNILFGIIGLLVGLICGFIFANSYNRNAAIQPTLTQNAPNSTVSNPQTQSVSIKESTGAMMPEVAQNLEKAKNEPDNFEAQIRTGEIFLKIQNAEKANEFFKRAAETQPDTFENLARLGNGFFDIKNYEEAEKWYSAALAKNPESVDVRTDLGSTFMERAQPDLERAIKEYRTSLEKNPKHENTIFNLSLALMRKGDKQGAEEMLAQLKKVNPQSSLIVKLEQKISEKALTN